MEKGASPLHGKNPFLLMKEGVFAFLRKGLLRGGLLLGLGIPLLSGCASLRAGDGIDMGEQRLPDVLLAQYQLSAVELGVGRFTLYSAIRDQRSDSSAMVGRRLRVYLEGDGYAWVDRYTPSSNPTPKSPLVVAMAGKDPSLRVAYLARPCQYIGSREVNTVCRDERLWTTHRYSEEVLTVLDAGLDQLKVQLDSAHLELVGYSGGGLLASLLAARRDDVDRVVTLVANLDLTAFESHHVLTRNLDSKRFEMISEAERERLRSLNQCHYVGDRDWVVPKELLEAYQARLQPRGCFQMEMVGGASHTDGWLQHWPDLMDLCRCGSRF